MDKVVPGWCAYIEFDGVVTIVHHGGGRWDDFIKYSKAKWPDLDMKFEHFPWMQQYYPEATRAWLESIRPTST